ncbi:MAG TPA: response regulator [Chthoniobacterales bacterium]
MAQETQNQLAEDSVHPLALKAILVVDDDKQLASALQWILKDENYLVDVAFDGEEALLKVRVHEYDAVICDVMMPRLRGDEFYVQAKKLRPNLTERFIFITGFGADSNIREFLSARRLKYLIKPFPINELMTCVKELLAGKP